MKIATGLLIWAACMPYLALADSDSDAAAAAAAAAASSDVDLPDGRRIVCNCSPDPDPVCGTNGITYRNRCVLRCVSDDHVRRGLPPIGEAYPGECGSWTCQCSKDIAAVCGTDGLTYRNYCILRCYSRYNQAHGLPAINVKHNGPCVNETCICPKIKHELCASDGVTYYNECALECQNRRRFHLGLDPLTVQYPGKCIVCICPQVYDPVCASDGNTYPSECVLECENLKRKRLGLEKLTVRWNGECACTCSWKWRPVCASDRRTWPNPCTLECENIIRVSNGLSPLTVLYNGECGQCNCYYCSTRYLPVCGSDGQTYRNNCWLDCSNDCRPVTGAPWVWKVWDGVC